MSGYQGAKAKYERKRRKEADEPVVKRTHWPCTAEGCEMAGSLSTGSGDWCGHHARVIPDDLARVTSVMNHHHHLRDAIVLARNFVGSEARSHAFVRAELIKLSDLLQNMGYGSMQIGDELIEIAPYRGEEFNSFIYRLHRALEDIIRAELGKRPKSIRAQRELEASQ